MQSIFTDFIDWNINPFIGAENSGMEDVRVTEPSSEDSLNTVVKGLVLDYVLIFFYQESIFAKLRK